MENYIVYDNRKFTLYPGRKYYATGMKGGGISLHRYKYIKEVGKIPEGYHIHHKDYNKLNNNIENLVCLSAEEHAKFHIPSKSLQDKWQKAGTKKAVVWHASEPGNIWHKENYHKNVKEKLHEKMARKCASCGTDILTTRKITNCFCSNNCKSLWRRKNKPDKKNATCPTCHKEFETLKYLPNIYCSRECKPAPNPKGFWARVK